MLTITTLNVGKGESIVLKREVNGNRYFGIIDSNTTSASSQGVLRDYLASEGAGELSFAALTHPHADHYTGLLEVLGKYPTDEFYSFNIIEDFSNPDRVKKLAMAYDEARKRSDSDEFKRHTEEFVRLLAFAWQEYGKTKRWFQPNGLMNQVFPRGFADQNCSIHMILPPPRVKGGFYTALDTNGSQVVERSKENELSLAFLIKYGSSRVVLGGDATHDNWALHRVKTNPGHQDTRFGAANLGAIAAKLPHHGSSIDCSEEVIDYIYMPRPAGERRRIAVISADGKSHPSPLTLNWLDHRDIGPYCTNLAVQCGGTVHNLKMTPGLDPALSRFIATNSEPTRNAMTPCQGHVHLHFDDNGQASVTTQNNAFCAYRNKSVIGI